MAKEANITEIVQTLQDAQQNKELLGALTTSLERYVEQQKKGLEELESLITKAKEGKLTVKKRGGYRGRKSKANSGSETEGQ
ncbi:hypothetical protein [Adhaeribacter radiodurans]|uniref:Uncharacterized protein n=1 Tax=Adhaeribacter radiodurans TaxID=2745197 RepID=A0A7L7L958_9BACT|nr:hypothetical protein [Adhaeribacter radiodurans]QMU29283.1 hypothetical protein HUW48_15125 [Adhaeribacter radiodurans]